jgi:hypothetical protein
MPIVEVNGQELEFPDDMQPDAIKAVLREKFPAANENQSQTFGQRVGSSIEGSYDKAKDIFKQSTSGQLNPAMGGIQILGQGVNAASALPAEAIASILPDEAKQAIGSAANYIGNLPRKASAALENTSVGRGVGDYLMERPELAKTLGQVADTAKAAGTIATAVPLAKAGRAVTAATGSGMETVGNAIYKSGEQAFKANRNSFVQDLITPKLTAGVRAEQFGRATEKGLMRNRVVAPSAQEQAIIDTIAELPVKKSKSLLGNANIIEKAKNAEAENLVTALKANDVAIADDVILNKLFGVRNELAKNPYIVGDGAKAADNVLNSAIDIIAQNPRTASGLLEARKQLDKLVASQRGSKLFDPALESPITNAVQQIRQSINDMVADAVPDAGVKASLAKQSNMYRALENITTKGAYEKASRLGRAASKVQDAVSLKGAIGAAAAAGGLGALGGTSVLVPAALGGAALYGAGKALTSPSLRKAIGSTLTGSGKILKKVK